MKWPQIPLRRAFRLVNGGTPTGEAENWAGDIPWATPVDVGLADGGYLTETQRTLSELGLLGSGQVPGGSLLVSTRAPIGYVAQVVFSTAFNQGCRGLVPTTEIDSRYFRYQLLSLSDELQSRGAGSTFLELSSDALASVGVVFPPVDEQRRIADFLDVETRRLDAVRAVRERMAALLELRRELLVEELIGMNSIPNWVQLKYAVEHVGVGIVVNPSLWYVDAGGIPALRGVNVRPGEIDERNLVCISTEGHVENAKSMLKAGDVVVVRTGQAGAAAVVPTHLAGGNCIDLLIIRPGSAVDPDFLAHYINSRFVQE